MRKPDIFDEIIQCLRNSGGADTSIDEETYQTLYMPGPRRGRRPANPPAAPAPVISQPIQTQGYAPAAQSQTEQVQGQGYPRQAQGRPQEYTQAAQGHPQPVQSQPVQVQGQGMPRIPAYAPDFPEWEALRAESANCMNCRLGATRTHLVFADGNPHAQLMFIGEGPGADEDAQGVPFVGRAGELLSRMIAAMTFDRQTETCIANIVKCRPPGNRNPSDDEAAACMPWLKRQIELVNPHVIVLLGAVPLLYLFNLKGIMKLRGRWLYYNGIKVMPTYHPAFLLRNPAAKKDAWADLKAVMAEFGRRPAPRS